MQEIPSAKPLLHILVCTNERPQDNPKPSCGRNGGVDVRQALRDEVTRRGLLGRVYVTRTGCLGWCHVGGTTVTVYPSGTFYRKVQPEDAARILGDHLDADA